MSSSRGGPLAGVRVIELTKVWAGPYVGKLLAYLGAEVIRVESLESLDTTRSYNVSDIDNAPGFQSVNPQKLSVQLNMRNPRAIKLILDLLRKSDVLVENMRPGAIERMGLAYDTVRAVRPEIVYVSVGMYGADGPLAYQTGYAPCFAALAGLSDQVGYEGRTPLGMNIRYGDSTVGATAAYAALVGLLHRRRTGLGQFIDVSAVEALTSMVADSIIEYSATGRLPERAGNRVAHMAPHGVFPCRAEEWISIAVSSDEAWSKLAQAMGRGDLVQDERFATLCARKVHEPKIDALLSRWTSDRDAGELAAELQALGVAAAKCLNSIELVAEPHLWRGGFYPTVADRAGNERSTVGASWSMSRGAEIRDRGPALGEQNAYVLGEILGLSADEQRKLADAGVVR